MTREPLTEAKIRPMQSRRCPFCRSDSSRAVGTRVDVWAKCQNCRSVRFYSAAAPFDPVYRLRGALGRAGSLKARLTL